jgi:hypothetical protein
MSELEQAKTERDTAIKAATSMMGHVFPAFDGIDADPQPDTERTVEALQAIRLILDSPDRATIWTADDPRPDLLPELMVLVEKALTANLRVKQLEGKTDGPT